MTARIAVPSWAVVERATNTVVGDAGFGVFAETGDVEIGWTLARDRWGRGYATEAARACLEAATALQVERVIAVVDTENLRSHAVAQRLGMNEVQAMTVAGRGHSIYAHLFATP